ELHPTTAELHLRGLLRTVIGRAAGARAVLLPLLKTSASAIIAGGTNLQSINIAAQCAGAIEGLLTDPYWRVGRTTFVLLHRSSAGCRNVCRILPRSPRQAARLPKWVTG